MNGTLQDAPTFFWQINSLRYVSNYPYIFSKAFATHLPHSFCYMFTFHSHTCSYIWEATSCYIRTCLHSFENKFILHLHWKSNFCTTHSHSWKAISYHMFLLWDAFSCHFQHICTFAKHLATYSTYTCTWWTTFSHYLGTRKTWCSPNQVLALRGNLTNMLSLIMPSCISTNKSLGPLGLSHVLAFIKAWWSDLPLFRPTLILSSVKTISSKLEGV